MALSLHTASRDNWSPQDFVTLIIEPVLCHLDAHSVSAAQLLLGTAVHESGGLKHRRQVGGGPALSFFQMERATHDDIWANYLRYKKSLAASITSLMTDANANKHNELEFNDNYAAGMARAHYRRVSQALPEANDLEGHANYWKAHYNTSLGAGTPTKYLNDWRHHVPDSITFRTGC